MAPSITTPSRYHLADAIFIYPLDKDQCGLDGWMDRGGAKHALLFAH